MRKSTEFAKSNTNLILSIVLMLGGLSGVFSGNEFSGKILSGIFLFSGAIQFYSYFKLNRH